MNETKNIVVCIPAFNEERFIAKVVLGAKKYASNVVVCDDGSTDMTGEIAKALGAQVIRHEANSGKGDALRSLFLASRELDADIMVTMDGDGQHEAAEIPSFIDAIEAGGVDVVIGSRFISTKNEVPSGRKIGNKLLNVLTPADVTDSQSGFRAYSRRVIDSITPGERGMGVDSEIIMEASRLGFRIMEIPISVKYGIGKTSKRNALYHVLDVVSSVVKLVSINHPLIFYGIPGSILCAIGLYYAFLTYNLVSKTAVITNLSLTYGLIAFALALVGLLILFTGIILFTISTVVRKGGSHR
jgi:glycosyltransferase involved in cell wall biosynthesis